MFKLLAKLFGGGDSTPRVRRVKPQPIAAEDLRQLLLAHERMSIWLTPTEEPRFSKLGGAPDIDGDLDWPEAYNGGPMAFVAQLALADIRAAGGPDWLPGEGALYFFTDTGTINPGGGGCVRYVVKPSTAKRATSATGVHTVGAQTFGSRRLAMEAHPSQPTADWLNLGGRCADFDDDDDAVMEGLAPGRTDNLPDHRFAGYPSAVQNDSLALES